MGNLIGNFNWGRGNSKVSKLAGAFSFGLPAFESADGFKVCPMAGACAGVCYARVTAATRYAAPDAVAAREFNLASVRRDVGSFATRAEADLRRSPSLRIVRAHDSGDFFSQEYLDQWYALGRAMPHIRFYAYTKSLHLDIWSNRPANFSMVQSQGGRLDQLIDITRPHSRIFATDYARRAAGYGMGSNTDALALEGKTARIGLIYHGTRKLTPAQGKFFR